MMNYRSAYGLPERYFLSLGRMVEKKNLSTLVEAYARFAHESGERSRAEIGNLNRSGAEIAEGKLEVLETADGGPGGVASPPQAEETGVRKQSEAGRAEDCKLNTEHCVPALVFVGSGELEGALREQARALGLRVVDCTAAGSQSSGVSRLEGTAANCKLSRGSGRQPLGNTEHSVENHGGAVFFYGFRQIEENAVFYALAEAFVLPSLYEEWGLVVNEAMAAGLPVIVSRTAGCAEDLLPASGQVTSDVWRVTSKERKEEASSRSSQCSVGRAERSEPQTAPRQRDGSATTAAARDRCQAISIQSGGSETTENCKPQTENSLEQRSNGFAFDPTSVDALSEALRRIADYRTAGRQDDDKANGGESGQLRHEMGKRSREIVAKFSCGSFAQQAMRAACAAQQA
jgi:glycosyltransferase involved in cell wall biosynthesis